MLILVAILLGAQPAVGSSGGPAPFYRSLPATTVPTARDSLSLPYYRQGKVLTFHVRDSFAYLIQPTVLNGPALNGAALKGAVVRSDRAKPWVWVFPFEHGLRDAGGNVAFRFYVDKLLAAGFHVAGLGVGVSCGSPRAAERCEEFHALLVKEFGLSERARLLAQSNGGLIAYAWAYRHPGSVDRIAGIYPATDVRVWPGLSKLLVYPTKGLGFDLTAGQLAARLSTLNPIDNLAPLARSNVRLLHIHGDSDKVVPIGANSIELVRRYKRLGGSAELIVVKGFGHGGKPFSESKELAAFLLAK